MQNNKFITKSLWKDEEIVGRIYLQYSDLIRLMGDLPESIRTKLDKTIKSLLTILSAINYHNSNFLKYEEKAINEAKNLLENKQNQIINENYEMIFEVEALLFQLKCSLDLLAKFLYDILEEEYKRIAYYEGGDDLIRKLN